LEVDRWKRSARKGQSVDDFVRYEESRISWTRDLKKDLTRGRYAEYEESKIRRCLYRPYQVSYVFFDRILNEEIYGLEGIFPSGEAQNLLICLTGPGSEKPFLALASESLVDFHLVGAASGTQCFPFYTYAEDGTNRRENITDWALEQFRARYGDPSITRWDIFHYVYAVLHHPEYRERYAANLRRELPRIPFVAASTTTLSSRAQQDRSPANDLAESRDLVFADAEHGRGGEFPARTSSARVRGKNASESQAEADSRSFDSAIRLASESAHSAQDDRAAVMSELDVFRAFVQAGKRLAKIHVYYEKQPEYPLTKIEKAGEKLDYRVTKMRLSKDKTTLTYNQFLTLSEIPKETYEYRLGNRSALEWVIDQYEISTDKRSGITNDPNRADDSTYIFASDRPGGHGQSRNGKDRRGAPVTRNDRGDSKLQRGITAPISSTSPCVRTRVVV